MTVDTECSYRAIFERAPVSLWDEDFTAVVRRLDELAAAGVSDFEAYFAEHPEVVGELAGAVQVLEVNQCTLDMFGASSKNELLGSLDKVFVPETFPVFIRQMVAVASGASEFSSEAYVKTLRGDYIYIYMTLNWLPEERGMHRGLVTCLDISRRKQAEDRLAAQERLHRTLTESIPHMIWMGDERGRLTYCNRAMREAVGVTLEDARGRDWLDVIQPDDAERIARVRSTARENHTAYRGECTFRAADGNQRAAYFIETPVTEGRGEVVQWVGVNNDVTELEMAREHLQRSLDRASRELAQIAHAASHDFQEPLRMVVSYAQLIELNYRAVLDERAGKYFSYLTEGARRIRQLILALLELSDVNSEGRQPEPTDAQLSLERVLLAMGDEIEDRGAEVAHGALPVVMADPGQLGQVFRALLSNSIKFCTRSPRVHISARRDGTRWVFAIEDNGIGFDAVAYGDRVFEMFRRLHNRDSYPGNGVGLAVAQKIVERHGGRIWAESRPGQGAKFFFTLPAVDIESVVGAST